MKMEESLKQTAKVVIYNTYSRIVDNPLEYENITGKKMLKKVEAFYSNPSNILEICTERELKFLKKVLNNNVDGWEQGITTDKIKQTLNNFKACSDKNGTCLISTPDIQIEKIIKSLGIEKSDLTTIDKIDKFKNQLNKGLFM